ncbi:MAG: squalene synthase HpnC [Nitrospirota bacterium]|nr:squalene synthase HpnC [Nitrospirota bacterium]
MIPQTLKRDYDHCLGIARGHYENFPVASLLVPSALRPHVAAVYAFARRADDFADEAPFEGRRLERLSAWQAMLEAAAQGDATHPVFRALAHTMSRFDLPAQLFSDLLSAFRQDVTVTRYATFDELTDYCHRSADPVGRLVLRLFGYADTERDARSDAICTGLQLANFWQDVAVDVTKGRIYIPIEDMDRFGVPEEEVLGGQVTGAFRDLMAFQVARTRELFAFGKPLCGQVSGRLSLELKAVWLGGMGILDAVERVGYDVFSRRPVHRTRDRARFVARVLMPGGFNRAYGNRTHG